jgi:hypothetical protein
VFDVGVDIKLNDFIVYRIELDDPYDLTILERSRDNILILSNGKLIVIDFKGCMKLDKPVSLYPNMSKHAQVKSAMFI